MSVERATDEVTDLIASIEMHRQEIERESGRAASCSFALPKLQEILQREQEALLAQGPDAAANVEAVTNAINKVKSLAGNAGQRSAPPRAGPRPPQQGQRRHPPHAAGKSRGRRPMGRRSGR